jgi:hypothetical protein
MSWFAYVAADPFSVPEYCIRADPRYGKPAASKHANEAEISYAPSWRPETRACRDRLHDEIQLS